MFATLHTTNAGYNMLPVVSFGTVLMTYKNNLLTRGDEQGAIPVIRWVFSEPTPDFTLQLTLTAYGVMEMALVFVEGEGGTCRCYQSDWIVVE
jgi:hypothetical protein